MVAFPTETVYGLGANALDAAAVAKIFAAKGRPEYNPLIVHVASASAAKRLVRRWDERAEKLAAAFWPGPLTLVLPKSPEVPDSVTAGLDTVAIRVPAHPVAAALLEASQLAIAAPSANRSSEVSPTRAEHVLKSLGGRIDLILDGGATDVGIESTVVDLTDDVARILRPGVIGIDRIREHIAIEPAASNVGEAAPRPSPGMLDRHYAPRAVVRLFSHEELDEVRREIAYATEVQEVTGAIIFPGVDINATHVVRMPDDAAGYARVLYETFHALDDRGCDILFVQRPPRSSEWDGVRDRVQRAAHAG